MSFGKWLASVRVNVTAAAAGKASAHPVTIVAGNEASDADSIISALTYAYFRGCKDSEKNATQTIPIIACNRSDMMLRRETVHLLGLCGVVHGDLLFLNDPEMDKILASVEQVVLVDHNKAVGPLAPFDAKVTEIVDHHKDVKSHGHVVGELRKIAFEGEHATAGSCCTLITEAFLASAAGKELLLQDGGAVARALLGVILIDTINLDPKAKKATPRDIAAVAELELMAPLPPRAELFTQLDTAKFDAAFWDSLAVDQCLRYDYKQFENDGKVLGMSSVLCPLESLAGKVGWCEELNKWSSKVDLYGVLTNSKTAGGGPPQRQMALVSSDGGVLAAQAANFAAAYDAPALQLEPMELAGPPGLKVFRQHNTSASRKQVAPCLGAFFAAKGSGL